MSRVRSIDNTWSVNHPSLRLNDANERTDGKKDSSEKWAFPVDINELSEHVFHSNEKEKEEIRSLNFLCDRLEIRWSVEISLNKYREQKRKWYSSLPKVEERKRNEQKRFDNSEHLLRVNQPFVWWTFLPFIITSMKRILTECHFIGTQGEKGTEILLRLHRLIYSENEETLRFLFNSINQSRTKDFFVKISVPRDCQLSSATLWNPQICLFRRTNVRRLRLTPM